MPDQSGYLRGTPPAGNNLGPLVITGGTNGNAALGSEQTLQEIRDDVNTRRQQFDYYQPAGASTWEVRYIGSAVQGTASSAASWTVRRLSHSLFGGEARVTDIQTLTGAWDNRAALPWT